MRLVHRSFLCAVIVFLSASMMSRAFGAETGWNKPGANPYMGEVPAAVQNYKDIPQATRDRLQERMQRRDYDDRVAITRDQVTSETGAHDYAPTITDMHSGGKKLMKIADRSKWQDGWVERGLVYCDTGYCILVPTVCRNVSRIARLPKRPPPKEVATLVPDVPYVWTPEEPTEGVPGPVPVGMYAGPIYESAGGYAGGYYGGGYYGGSGGGGGGGGYFPCESCLCQEVPPIAPVPEPTTYAYLVLGLAACFVAARRRA